MGCGASIFAWRGASSLDARPMLEPAPAVASRGLVTPPEGRRPLPHGAPTAKKGLRIDTAAASREKAGLSETPVGKAADEYKYYCPICMMFFRSILELPCCRQSTCAFCFSEYLQRQLNGKDSPSAETTDAINAAAAAAPAAASGGKTGRAAAARLVLPAGTACPQCCVACKAEQALRVVEGFEEVQVKYIESPQTRAQMERKKAQHPPADEMEAKSPLKVGDDFNAMARKMLPFGKIGREEAEETEAAQAEAVVGVGVGACDAAAAAPSSSAAGALPPAEAAAGAGAPQAVPAASPDAVSDAVDAVLPAAIAAGSA